MCQTFYTLSHFPSIAFKFSPYFSTNYPDLLLMLPSFLSYSLYFLFFRCWKFYVSTFLIHDAYSATSLHCLSYFSRVKSVFYSTLLTLLYALFSKLLSIHENYKTEKHVNSTIIQKLSK